MVTTSIDGIPVFRALVDAEGGDTGMIRISLVDDPAVESNFVAFDKQRKMQIYSVADEQKRLVLGVVMRADFPIYRRDAVSGEYYIVYPADTIRTMAEKYLVEGRQNDVNLMHEEGSDVKDVDMVQWFIKDTGKGVAPVGFEDIADGSLFAEFHILNDDVWNAIQEGTYKGFSLEGIFDMIPEKDKEYVEQIEDALYRAVKQVINPNKDKMSKIKGLMARLAKALVEMGSTTTDKGILAWDGEEDLKAGDAVYVEDADGNRTPAPEGEYRTEDGKVIVVVDSKVAEINDDEAQVAPAEAEAETEATEETKFGRKETDKGPIEWEGEGDLEAGMDVFVVDAEGNRVPAPDGDYVTDDAKVIVVTDGKVSEIKDAEAEVAPQDAPEVDAEKETLRAENEELRSQNEALRSEVDELKAQVEKLSKEPAGKDAHEEFTSSIVPGKTGNKGLDRLAQIMSKN